MTATSPAEFAALLRTLADLYDAQPELPVPGALPFCRYDREGAPESFAAVRRLFPDAELDQSERYMVRLYTSLDGYPLSFSWFRRDLPDMELSA